MYGHSIINEITECAGQSSVYYDFDDPSLFNPVPPMSSHNKITEYVGRSPTAYDNPNILGFEFSCPEPGYPQPNYYGSDYQVANPEFDSDNYQTPSDFSYNRFEVQVGPNDSYPSSSNVVNYGPDISGNDFDSSSFQFPTATEDRNPPTDWSTDMSNSFGLTAQPYPTLTDPPGQSYLTQQISDYTSVKTRGELAAERRRIRPAIHRCYIDGCEKKFTTKQNLKNHILGTHEGIQPYSCGCPLCGFSTSYASDLPRHMKSRKHKKNVKKYQESLA